MSAVSYQAWLASIDSPDHPVHLLSADEQWIGREDGCEIQVFDQYVSRRQAKLYWKKNLLILEDYGHNPVLVNGEPVKEIILKDGDRLKVGSSEFLVQMVSVPVSPSTRPAPVEPKVEEKKQQYVPTHEKPGSKSPLPYLVFLVVIMLIATGVFFSYQEFFMPWHIKRKLFSVEQELKAGKIQSAHDHFLNIFRSALSFKSEDTRKAAEKLALDISNSEMKAGDFEKAEGFLNRFILFLGTAPESSEVSKLLDRCRIKQARELSSNGQFFAAFRKLALISQKSPFFQEAQELLDQFWVAYQQKNLKHFTMKRLLVLAEENLKSGHYVKPARYNAYTIYQAVLSLESRNEDALAGIRRIRNFLLQKANAYFKEKKYREALDYYQRYKLTDSNNAFVNKKIRSCRRHLGGRKK